VSVPNSGAAVDPPAVPGATSPITTPPASEPSVTIVGSASAIIVTDEPVSVPNSGAAVDPPAVPGATSPITTPPASEPSVTIVGSASTIIVTDEPDLFNSRAKRVWPLCSDGAGLDCSGPLGGPASCKGAAYIDTMFYGRLVPEKDHVQYVHGDVGVKFDYEAGEKMCQAQSMDVCSQDQLGAAWLLGYENGCRGYTSDKWALGMPDAALMDLHDRRGQRISNAPSGIVLAKAGALRVGMNGRFEDDEQVVGTYCCSRTNLNKGGTRPCDQQLAQAAPQLQTANYIRWFEHLRNNGGYTALIAGTLIGALRNHSLIPECAESKHTSGILFQEPDVDLIMPGSQWVGGDIFNKTGFFHDLAADPLQIALQNAPTTSGNIYTNDAYEGRWEGFIENPMSFSSSRLQLCRHAGVLFPMTTASGTSDDWKGLAVFLEQWDYAIKDEQEGRGVWLDVSDGTGGICEEAFNVKTLEKVDVSIGAFPAHAYIMKGSERFLDTIYGTWRSKLDKQAYSPGEGKERSWSQANVVEVCQEVHQSDSAQGI